MFQFYKQNERAKHAKQSFINMYYQVIDRRVHFNLKLTERKNFTDRK